MIPPEGKQCISDGHSDKKALMRFPAMVKVSFLVF